MHRSMSVNDECNQNSAENNYQTQEDYYSTKSFQFYVDWINQLLEKQQQGSHLPVDHIDQLLTNGSHLGELICLLTGSSVPSLDSSSENTDLHDLRCCLEHLSRHCDLVEKLNLQPEDIVSKHPETLLNLLKGLVRALLSTGPQGRRRNRSKTEAMNERWMHSRQRGVTSINNGVGSRSGLQPPLTLNYGGQGEKRMTLKAGSASPAPSRRRQVSTTNGKSNGVNGGGGTVRSDQPTSLIRSPSLINGFSKMKSLPPNGNTIHQAVTANKPITRPSPIYVNRQSKPLPTSSSITRASSFHRSSSSSGSSMVTLSSASNGRLTNGQSQKRTTNQQTPRYRITVSNSGSTPSQSIVSSSRSNNLTHPSDPLTSKATPRPAKPQSLKTSVSIEYIQPYCQSSNNVSISSSSNPHSNRPHSLINSSSSNLKLNYPMMHFDKHSSHLPVANNNKFWSSGTKSGTNFGFQISTSKSLFHSTTPTSTRMINPSVPSTTLNSNLPNSSSASSCLSTTGNSSTRAFCDNDMGIIDMNQDSGISSSLLSKASDNSYCGESSSTSTKLTEWPSLTSSLLLGQNSYDLGDDSLSSIMGGSRMTLTSEIATCSNRNEGDNESTTSSHQSTNPSNRRRVGQSRIGPYRQSKSVDEVDGYNMSGDIQGQIQGRHSTEVEDRGQDSNNDYCPANTDNMPVSGSDGHNAGRINFSTPTSAKQQLRSPPALHRSAKHIAAAAACLTGIPPPPPTPSIASWGNQIDGPSKLPTLLTTSTIISPVTSASKSTLPKSSSDILPGDRNLRKVECRVHRHDDNQNLTHGLDGAVVSVSSSSPISAIDQQSSNLQDTDQLLLSLSRLALDNDESLTLEQGDDQQRRRSSNPLSDVESEYAGLELLLPPTPAAIPAPDNSVLHSSLSKTCDDERSPRRQMVINQQRPADNDSVLPDRPQAASAVSNDKNIITSVEGSQLDKRKGLLDNVKLPYPTSTIRLANLGLASDYDPNRNYNMAANGCCNYQQQPIGGLFLHESGMKRGESIDNEAMRLSNNISPSLMLHQLDNFRLQLEASQAQVLNLTIELNNRTSSAEELEESQLVQINQLRTMNALKDNEIGQLKHAITVMRSEISSMLSGTGNSSPKFASLGPHSGNAIGTIDQHSIDLLARDDNAASTTNINGIVGSANLAGSSNSLVVRGDSNAVNQSSWKRSRWLPTSLNKALKKRSRSIALSASSESRSQTPVRPNYQNDDSALAISSSPVKITTGSVDSDLELTPLLDQMKRDLDWLVGENRRLRQVVLNTSLLSLIPSSIRFKTGDRPGLESLVRTYVERPTIYVHIYMELEEFKQNRSLDSQGQLIRKCIESASPRLLTIGIANLNDQSTWSDLDSAVQHALSTYLQFIDPSNSLHLSHRFTTSPQTDDYRVGLRPKNANSASIYLANRRRHHGSPSVDLLVESLLISAVVTNQKVSIDHRDQTDQNAIAITATTSPRSLLDAIPQARMSNNDPSANSELAVFLICWLDRHKDRQVHDLDLIALQSLIPADRLEEWSRMLATTSIECLVLCGPTGLNKRRLIERLCEVVQIIPRQFGGQIAIHTIPSATNDLPSAVKVERLIQFLEYQLINFQSQLTPKVVLVESLHNLDSTSSIDAVIKSTWLNRSGPKPKLIATSDRWSQEFESLQSESTGIRVMHFFDRHAQQVDADVGVYLGNEELYLDRHLHRNLAQHWLAQPKVNTFTQQRGIDSNIRMTSVAMTASTTIAFNLANWLPRLHVHLTEMVRGSSNNGNWIGLDALLTCPFDALPDVSKVKHWFTKTWNASLVGSLMSSVTGDSDDGGHRLSTFIDWLLATWPWPRQPALMKLIASSNCHGDDLVSLTSSSGGLVATRRRRSLIGEAVDVRRRIDSPTINSIDSSNGSNHSSSNQTNRVSFDSGIVPDHQSVCSNVVNYTTAGDLNGCPLNKCGNDVVGNGHQEAFNSYPL